MARKLAYPPCKTNPATEKPYSRHKWVIPPRVEVIIKRIGNDDVYFYRVRCSRCGFNDPNPPTR